MASALRVFKDSDELAAHAADHIVRIAQKAIGVRGRAMQALAGGSTPKKTYRLLAQPDRRGRIDWAHTYLPWRTPATRCSKMPRT
jgi:6-phosphogluconolactonase